MNTMFVDPEKAMSVCLLYLLFPEMIVALFFFWVHICCLSVATVYTAYGN